MPRGRTVLAIAACLIGGMLINVLVAWGCLWHTISISGSNWKYSHRTGPRDWPTTVPAYWPPTAMTAAVLSSYGAAFLTYMAPEPEPADLHTTNSMPRDRFTVWEQRYGWPLHSMVCGQGQASLALRSLSFGQSSQPPLQPVTFVDRLYRGRAPPAWMHPHNPPVLFPPTFPLLPIATGSIANTLIYAAMLWPLFVVLRVLQTARRRRRGQCLACGYDLAALPKCPECGIDRAAGTSTRKAPS